MNEVRNLKKKKKQIQKKMRRIMQKIARQKTKQTENDEIKRQEIENRWKKYIERLKK